jgi:glyoxylase-like metal-dependent hydrolase (beta-lactamase superfamily II)
LPEELHLPQDAELLPFTPAHTPADVAVWFPRTRTLITGDICFNRVVPLAVNGLLSGWLEAIEALIKLEPAVVVPGHGAIGTLADLSLLHDYFSRLQTIGRAAVEAQVSLEDALATFDPGPLAEWLEQERHEINLERAMQEARGDISREFLALMPASAVRHQTR